MRTELVLRFDYGRTVPWVSRLPDGTFRAIAGPDMVVLHTPVALHGENLTTVGDLSTSRPAARCRSCSRTARRICRRRSRSTSKPRWKTPKTSGWTGPRAVSRDGEWSDAVTRSLITLKALTYAPTGGIVAAPTTSLPEKLGGVRNWDYRFCWLRDATLTLLALMNAGYYDEAQAWRDWLLRAAAGSPSQLQIMYGLAGERRLSEYEVPWLPGYEQSTPVRIGNAAHGQLQLDVYGEVIDALFQAQARWTGHAADADWAFQRAILEHLERGVEPSGRGHLGSRAATPQHFTYSKVMAWVALDRGIRAIEGDQASKGPSTRWREVRQAHPRRGLRARVRPRARQLRPVVRLEESRREPAAHPHDRVPASRRPAHPRHHRSRRAPPVRRRLRAPLRHAHDRRRAAAGRRRVPRVQLLAGGRTATQSAALDDARQLFERLLGLRNDVGLLAEEYDTGAKRLVGNFPQAFSHIALVNSAHNLGHAVKPAEQRSSRDNGER